MIYTPVSTTPGSHHAQLFSRRGILMIISNQALCLPGLHRFSEQTGVISVCRAVHTLQTMTQLSAPQVSCCLPPPPFPPCISPPSPFSGAGTCVVHVNGCCAYNADYDSAVCTSGFLLLGPAPPPPLHHPCLPPPPLPSPFSCADTCVVHDGAGAHQGG